MEVEKIPLTEAQARELYKATCRAAKMYADRSAGGAVAGKLRGLKDPLKQVKEGDREALKLGLGMDGEDREALIAILEREYDIENRKNSEGWKDGREINAFRRGLDAMKDPEIVEVEL